MRISTAAGIWLALFFASCLNRDDSGAGGTPSAFPVPGRTRGGSGGSRNVSSRNSITNSSSSSSSSSAFIGGSGS
ncbi:hypothetical protein CLOM_g7388 [Closterium sp. NIES-68]|nr:hypothetical protein CLOM_g7388 [Closterium sp. NIES-68]